MAQSGNISIISAGPDGSGNPYDLTVVADDTLGQISNMTVHLSQGSTDVWDVTNMQYVSGPATDEVWAPVTPIPAVDLPAGTYTITVDATDTPNGESDPGLAGGTVAISYSATTINVTPSSTFVTEGSQKVTFTGKVTGTAQDGSNTQVPIGDVTVNVSNGDQATTSASGAFSYTTPSLSQSTSFDFTVAAAGDGSYPAGDSGAIQISAQQATTSISVTPSPASISQGSQQVTFSGQVTAAPAGGGPAVPVSGAVVSVSAGGGPTIQVGPTGADGSFSYGPTGVSAATDFSFSVPGSNLYGPAANDVSIGIAQATTSISVAPSQPFVTQGANNVTFTGQVTVAPAGGGPPVPIGSGVPVQITGGGTATTVTTDGSGDFNYTASGLTASSTSFSFVVNPTSLYTAASQTVSIPAEQATTALAVTPSQGTIELGSPSVTFNGQVMITTPGSPAQQPIGADIPVTITGGSFSTTATTDSSGKFSATDPTITTATNFTFSVAGTTLYTPQSATAQIQAAAPAQTSIHMSTPGVSTFGSPSVPLSGTVAAVNASSTSVPLTGIPVYLNGSTTPVATTNSSGVFTYVYPGPPASPSLTFSVNQDTSPDPLYSATSFPFTVNVTPGQTVMSIQTSPATVNGGPQPVNFTVTLTVVPSGAGTSPEPIGSGVPVLVSINGGVPTQLGTTDSGGVLTKTIPNVVPGNDYDFTVAGNANALYSLADKDFAFGKQSTNLTVTPSQTSVTEGSQNVTFSGTATGVVGSSSAPITGATVDLNNSSAPVATTDSAGNFSYTAKGVSHAATYQFSIAGSPTYTPGSASVAIGLTAAPTRITFIKISPSALKYGQKATLQGAVQYKNGKTWAGLPGARVFLAEGKATLGSVVASKSGNFTAKLPTTHGFAWSAKVNAAVLTQQATAVGNLIIAVPMKVATFSAGLWTDGSVHTSGCLAVTAPVKYGPMSSIQLQYATSARGKWHLLGRLPLHNFDRKAKGCASSNNSFFTGAIRAASDNAYYRVMFPATSSFQAAVSKVIHSSRTQTKITSFTFSPRTLKKGQLATMTGRLWRKVGSAWKEYGGRRVEIIYNEKGTSFWGNLGSVTTNSKGYFKQLADGGPGNFTVTAYAQYAGSSTDLAARSAGIAVAIKQSGGAVSSTAPPGVQQLAVMIAANGPQSFMLTEQSVLILGVAPDQIGVL